MRTIACLAIVAVCAMSAQALVIDDFTSTSPAGGWTISPAIPAGTAYSKVETGLFGVYGGSRDSVYSAYLWSGYTNFSSSTGMDVGVYGPVCSLYNITGTWSKATITYNGGGGAGGLGLDLTSGTELAVDIGWDHVGQSKNSVLSITLNDGVQTATVSKINSPTKIGIEHFLFADFLSQNGALNMGSIDSIAVYVETDKAGDYEVYSVTTNAVPEPATLCLLTLGGLLLARRRRA